MLYQGRSCRSGFNQATFSLTHGFPASPISAIAWRTPMQHPKVPRYHVENCEMAANSATAVLQVFLPKTFRSYKQTVSPARLTGEGYGFRPLNGKLTPVVYDAMGRKGTYSCETVSSALQEALYWPKHGHRSLIASTV